MQSVAVLTSRVPSPPPFRGVGYCGGLLPGEKQNDGGYSWVEGTLEICGNMRREGVVTFANRSFEQKMIALEKANTIRALRRGFREELVLVHRGAGAAGSVMMLEGLLLEEPWWAAGWRVSGVLKCIPGWGAVRVGRCLVVCKIYESRTIAGLTMRKKFVLISHLKKWRDGRC